MTRHAEPTPRERMCEAERLRAFFHSYMHEPDHDHSPRTQRLLGVLRDGALSDYRRWGSLT